MLKEGDIEIIVSMEGQIREAAHLLAGDVVKNVPVRGRFEEVRRTFRDESGKLDIKLWWLCVRCYPIKEVPEDKRFIELWGYVGDGYGINTVEGSGSNGQCVNILLNDKGFVRKIQQSMVNKLQEMD